MIINIEVEGGSRKAPGNHALKRKPVRMLDQSGSGVSQPLMITFSMFLSTRWPFICSRKLLWPLALIGSLLEKWMRMKVGVSSSTSIIRGVPDVVTGSGVKGKAWGKKKKGAP